MADKVATPPPNDACYFAAAAWIKEDKLTKRQHKQYKKEQVARIKRGGVGEHATAPAMPLLRKEEKRWRLQLKVAQLGVRLIRVLQCFHKHGIGQ